MTPDTASMFLDRAWRQLSNGFCWCHITANDVEDMARSYLRARQELDAARRELAEARARLEKIEAIASTALLTACGTCYLGESWREVRELCNVAS